MLVQRIIKSSLVFQHIVENMHDGVLTIDNAGIITTVNPAAEAILEMGRETLLNKKLSDVFFTYPENDGFIQIILDAVYEASMTHHRVVGYFTGKNHKSLFMTTSFLKEQIGQVVESIGVTVLFSDVTELGELRDAAAALDKIKALNQKLEQLSYLDDLTGLPNRRFLNDVCNREWRRAARDREPVALIALDIDYFKELNDSNGHQAGDEALAEVADALGKELRRPGDMTARYGGDEFVVVLPGTDLDGAKSIADRICKSIFTLDIENAFSPFGRLTVSVGIAADIPVQNINWKDVLDNADKALYRAKNSGRNRVSE